jgi:hypothetical protein
MLPGFVLMLALSILYVEEKPTCALSAGAR